MSRWDILTRIVDVAKIKNAITVARNTIGGSKIMLIAKAYAYGNGLNLVNHLSPYVDYIGVAKVSEGVALRKRGVLLPILVLSLLKEKNTAYLLNKYNLHGCVDTVEKADICDNVHIAVDTGMNRFGVKSQKDFLEILNCKSNIIGVMSHIYHNSQDIVKGQCERFSTYVDIAKQRNQKCLAHIASSGSYSYPFAQYDMVRLGRYLYENAVSISSNILAVKTLYPGESVGYGGNYISDKKQKIAIVEGGYADGFDKRNSGGYALINGKLCPIIGAVCMDSFTVALEGVFAKAGDKVFLCDNNAITLSDIAKRTGCTVYETLTALNGRCKYIYFE